MSRNVKLLRISLNEIGCLKMYQETSVENLKVNMERRRVSYLRYDFSLTMTLSVIRVQSSLRARRFSSEEMPGFLVVIL